MKLSVIVPVYNMEKYIEKCLESVVDQLSEDMELIIVNDGSTDSSRKICEKYMQMHSQVFVFDKANGGLSSARNLGIEKARGEYLYFLDSDDWIWENTLAYLYECAKENSADIVIGEHVRVSKEQFDPLGENSACKPIDKEWVMRMILNTGPDAQEKYVMSCNKLLHRRLWEELRFPEGCYHEDEYVIHHLYHKADKIVYTDKVTYFYRTREDSITGNNRYNARKYQDFIGFSKSRKEFINKYYGSLYSDALRFYLENITIQYLIVGTEIEKSKILRKEAKRRIAGELYRNLGYMQWQQVKRYHVFLLSASLYRKRYWK